MPRILFFTFFRLPLPGQSLGFGKLGGGHFLFQYFKPVDSKLITLFFFFWNWQAFHGHDAEGVGGGTGTGAELVIEL